MNLPISAYTEITIEGENPPPRWNRGLKGLLASGLGTMHVGAFPNRSFGSGLFITGQIRFSLGHRNSSRTDMPILSHFRCGPRPAYGAVWREKGFRSSGLGTQ